MFKKGSLVQLHKCVHGECAKCSVLCKIMLEIGIVSVSNEDETSYVVNGISTSADNDFLRQYASKFSKHMEKLKCLR